MNLHRIKGQPEWENTADGRHNRWQSIAARSGGILTPGNALTVAGLLLALYGIANLLEHSYWTGLLALGTGRLLDLADGLAADSTATKSPLGEALDAGCDKLITVLAVIALFALQATPWYVLVLVVLPHVAISGLALLAAARGSRLHPSLTGKYSMATAWAGLGGLVLLLALPAGDTASLLRVIVYVCLAISVVLGFWALLGYAHGYKRTAQ